MSIILPSDKEFVFPSSATYGFEIDPPSDYDEASARKMAIAILRLAALGPSRFSVTFGANGTVDENTQQQSLRTSVAILEVLQQFPVAAHMACSGLSREDNINFAEQLHTYGIREILALSGDRLAEEDKSITRFKGAPLLIAYLQGRSEFKISAAADFSFYDMKSNDGGQSALVSIAENLRAKITEGATQLITQFTFQPDNVARGILGVHSEGIETPIIAGLIPVLNFPAIFELADKYHVPVPDDLRRIHDKIIVDVNGKPVVVNPGTIDRSGTVGQELIVQQIKCFANYGLTDYHFYSANSVPGMLTRIVTAGRDQEIVPYQPDEAQVSRLTKALLRRFER